MYVRAGSSGPRFCSGSAGLVKEDPGSRARGGMSAVEVILFPSFSGAPTNVCSISTRSVFAQFVTLVIAGSKTKAATVAKPGWHDGRVRQDAQGNR